jgi:hypothetical protein
MGDNTVHFGAKGGKRRTVRGEKRNNEPVMKKGGKRHTLRGGNNYRDLVNSTGAMLSVAYSRPFGPGSPPSVPRDMQDMWYGRTVGPSPNQIQRQPDYQLGSVYPTL